jgi:xylulokinase
MQILALDVGTSSVKAAVLDVATAEPVGPIQRVEYALDLPTPDTATIDPDRLWNAVVQAAGPAAQGQSVEGIGFSCLSPALVLLDQRASPVAPIITHLDRRSRPEARLLWQLHGHEFLRSVGNKPLPGGLTALAFQCLVKQDPDLPNRVRHYLHVNGWLGLRFTGVPAFDRGNACFTGVYDAMTSRTWSTRWGDYFGIQQAWLPPVHSGDETLGALRKDVAELLGLPAGIPVKLGTADTSCAMLAARMGRNDLLHVVGTTQVLAVHVDRPEPALNRITRQLGVGHGFIHVTHNPVGGVALDWLRELCFADQSEEEFYGRSVPAAMEKQTTVRLDPPFLGGDRLEIEPRRAAFIELTLGAKRLDLLAAVLNAMREHHAHALTALREPRKYDRVFLTGGGADVVHKLIPQYATMPVTRLQEASLRGVARLFESG